MPSTPASIAHGSQPTVRGGGTSRAKVTKKSKQAKSKTNYGDKKESKSGIAKKGL